MVWAGVSANARTDLDFIDGNLNGQRYPNKVLTPHVLPFLRRLGCAWKSCIGATRQEQHYASPSGSGPGSCSRPSENSFSLQRIESVNAGVTMVA